MSTPSNTLRRQVPPAAGADAGRAAASVNPQTEAAAQSFKPIGGALFAVIAKLPVKGAA